MNFEIIPEGEMLKRSEEFKNLMAKRRTVRNFSGEKIDFQIIKNCIQTASTAPSGANKQPWHFVVVASEEIKRRIRIEAEKRERKFYESTAPKEWLEDLSKLGTTYEKPFLTEAPYLIVVFAENYKKEGKKILKNYYVKESVGIATGFLITALHNAGLSLVTYTPAPMDFLNEILERPSNEKPFIVLAVGYPAKDVTVPKLTKKNFNEVCTVFV